jgi:hypothetical protein
MTNLGAQLLWRWTNDNFESQYDACKTLDCHPTLLNRWINGHSIPGRKWAVKMEKLSHGMITCGAWDEEPIPEYEIDPNLNPDFDCTKVLYKHRQRRGEE